MRPWLRPVADALDAAGTSAVLCFRDDDGGWDDARLLALLDCFADADVPLDVAVIPAALHPLLAEALIGRAGPRLRLHQHGFAHVDHERAGRKWEFGPARSPAAQRRDIATGRELLAELLGDVVDPVFTPPWNRCTVVTGRCLAELGFRVLSRESRAPPLGIPRLREVPVHVDWVRLPPFAAAERLAVAIRSGAPAGVMFHHAEMDRVSRDAASELLALVAGHERARPLSLLDAAGH
jgi:peptidoglycan/xylan/chitin deacetylase (PgdA/CDA1 family)